jgi:ribonuclease HII
MDRYQYERTLWNEGYRRIMGLDEVGRGCLCGPVVAAGVILKPGTQLNEKVMDSKLIGLSDRELLAEQIKKTSLFWTICEIPPRVIDEINILKASIRAMLHCSEAEDADPDYLLVDGNRFTNSLVPHSCIVKGDNRSVSIASASILAKVHRDRLMKKLHKEFPVFGWDKNVGYPTKTHFEGLQKHGYTAHHRKSFKLRTDKKFERL